MTACHDTDILLIEDNPYDAELTVRALTKHHAANQILTLPDGAEALEYIFATDRYASRSIGRMPKVILLDLKLPLVSGLDVLRRIKAHEKTRHIPIVVLTSSREESDIAASYELGANSYLVKPIDFADFTETVRQVGLYWVLLNEPPVTA